MSTAIKRKEVPEASEEKANKIVKKRRTSKKNNPDSFGDVLSSFISNTAAPVAAAKPTPAPVAVVSTEKEVVKTSKKKDSAAVEDKKTSKKDDGKTIADRANEKRKQDRATRREQVRQLRDQKRTKDGCELTERDQLILQQRSEKKKKEERILLLEKDFLPAEYNDLEKRLVRIGTKGVVTLFNAVSKQQKELAEIQAAHGNMNAKERLASETATTGFSEFLKEKGRESSARATHEFEESNAEDSDSDDDGKRSTTWKALDDDYMSGKNASRLKDWEVSDSESN